MPGLMRSSRRSRSICPSEYGTDECGTGAKAADGIQTTLWKLCKRTGRTGNNAAGDPWKRGSRFRLNWKRQKNWKLHWIRKSKNCRSSWKFTARAEAAQLKQSEEVHLSLAGLQQQDPFYQGEYCTYRSGDASFKRKKPESWIRIKEIQRKKSVREKRRFRIWKNNQKNPQRYFLKLRQKSADRPKTEKRWIRSIRRFWNKEKRCPVIWQSWTKSYSDLKARKRIARKHPEKQMNYMWEEYEITYNGALKLRDETLTDRAFMKKQILF